VIGAYKEDKKYRLPEWTWSLYLSWMTNDELKQKREELKNKFKEQKELTSSWVKAIKDENKQKVKELKFDLEKLKTSLNLTDAQVASLKELRTKWQKIAREKI
jgi:DNA repair exonuclease SbcCD ATPase subunit